MALVSFQVVLDVGPVQGPVDQHADDEQNPGPGMDIMQKVAQREQRARRRQEDNQAQDRVL